MKNIKSYVRTLSRLLFAILREGEGNEWAPYRDAMDWYLEAFAQDTLNEEEAKMYLENIVHRWNLEGCKLPIPLYTHEP